MTTKNVCMALALISASACGGGGGGGESTGPPAGNTPPPSGGISVTNNAFSPAAKTVTVGTTVTWAWNTCTGGGIYGGPETCVAHNIIFDDGTTSGLREQGTFTRTFAAAGAYNYHCSVHGTPTSGMNGSVTVQ